MQMRLYDIAPALRPYIKTICSMESDGTNALPSFRVLPDTCTELFINYREPALATIPGKIESGRNESFAVFRMNHYMDVQMHPGTGCIAVCFQSGAAHHFFPQPMSELSNLVVSIENLWKKAVCQLEDAITLATTTNERIIILQDFLLNQYHLYNKSSERRLACCLSQINLCKGQLSVTDIANHVNLGERQLNRYFSNYLGLSPKEYTSVNRFIHSLNHLKKYPTISLTEIAHDSGYYDQSHFIHDYQKYSGFTPGELLSLNNILFC